MLIDEALDDRSEPALYRPHLPAQQARKPLPTVQFALNATKSLGYLRRTQFVDIDVDGIGQNLARGYQCEIGDLGIMLDRLERLKVELARCPESAPSHRIPAAVQKRKDTPGLLKIKWNGIVASLGMAVLGQPGTAQARVLAQVGQDEEPAGFKASVEVEALAIKHRGKRADHLTDVLIGGNNDARRSLILRACTKRENVRASRNRALSHPCPGLTISQAAICVADEDVIRLDVLS